MIGDPRSKLDIIYQDVLGDVASLVGRLEVISLQVVAASTALDRPMNAAAEAVSEEVARACCEMRRELAGLVAVVTGVSQQVVRMERKLRLRFFVLVVVLGVALGALACLSVLKLMT